MKVKKGVVLLITISFILAITALYLKNLKDTKKLIDNSQNTYYLNYNLKILEDLNTIITKLNKNWELYESDNFNDFLKQVPSSGIPLEFKNVLINLKFESLEYKCNINNIYNDNKSKTNTCVDVLNNYNINFNNFYEATKDIYEENNTTILNNKRKNNILETFLQYNNIKNSENLKNDITFFSDTNTTKYLICNCEVNINDNSVNNMEIIYKLQSPEDSNESAKVEDIEISFK